MTLSGYDDTYGTLTCSRATSDLARPKLRCGLLSSISASDEPLRGVSSRPTERISGRKPHRRTVSRLELADVNVVRTLVYGLAFVLLFFKKWITLKRKRR